MPMKTDVKAAPRIAELTVTSVRKVGIEITPYGDTIGQMIDRHIADMGYVKSLTLEFPDEE